MNADELLRIASEDLKNHKNLLKHMESRKKKMPEGFLYTKSVGESDYHYHIIEKRGKRTQGPLSIYDAETLKTIEKLQEKSNLLHGIPIVRNNVSALETFIGNYKKYNPEELKYGFAADSKLYLDDDICLNEWMNEAYETNPFQLEKRIYETKSGINVRSKSEGLISDIAFDYTIPNRYECKMVINGKVLYPDFQLVRPFDRRLFIWEHFGMIDDLNYLVRNLPKLDIYPKGGFYLGYNFILTWETKGHPLTRSMVIEKLHENQFL